MSALADAARDYLQLRNSLGHDLAEHHRELPRFVAFLEAEGLPAVTVSAALAWAQGPGVDPATSIPPRRMTIARGFARYLAGIDARTEVPPPGLIAGRRRWRFSSPRSAMGRPGPPPSASSTVNPSFTVRGRVG
jgi:integrase/recombinase XerD